MSRSFKKPYDFIQPNDKRKEKRLASKRVRQFDESVPSGSFFKKVSDSYDIVEHREFKNGLKFLRK